MVKMFVLATLLWSSTALGDIDRYFVNGVPLVAWGTKLQDVQTIYPSGVTWEARNNDPDGARVCMSVAGDAAMLGIDVPVHLVHFCFGSALTLQAVHFHFNYADRDVALYRVAEALGQDYAITEKAGSRLYTWKNGRSSSAVLKIGITPPSTWAYLSVWAVERPPDSRK